MSPNGSVSLRSYSRDVNGLHFDQRRELVGGTTGPVAEPTVLVDGGGTLTIGWRERFEGGGLVVWQDDRPESTYLERGNMVPGTRDSEVQMVVAPKGTITVAFQQPGADPRPVKVKHLPAGKAGGPPGSG